MSLRDFFELDFSGSGGGVNSPNETNSSIIQPCERIPAYHPSFLIALQVCVNVVCVLSMLGASLIIFTFIAFKTLRTRARQILVQLSIADFVVAASHLVGVNVNLRKYAQYVCSDQDFTHNLTLAYDTVCTVQGAVTTYSTISSLFWTIAVGVYLLTVIVFENQRVGKWMTYLFYPLCWGLAAVVILSYALKKSFGFHANVDTGWCYLKANDDALNTSTNASRSFTPTEISSQIFIYLTYFTLLFLYIWIRCAIRFKIRRASNKQSISYQLQLKAKHADFKLTFIPLIFIALRIWGTILGIAYLYLPAQTWSKFRGTNANAAIVMLAAIGSSSQGFMNAMLFCVLTSAVRKRLLEPIKRCCCCCCRKDDAHAYLLEPSTNHSGGRISLENTTEYNSEEGRPVQGSISVNCSPGVLRQSRLDSTTGQYRESLDASKSHSMSVGKRQLIGGPE